MKSIVLRLIVAQFRTEYVKIRQHFVFKVAIGAPLAVAGVGVLDLMHSQMTGFSEHALWQRMYSAFWIPWLAALLPLLTSFNIVALVNFEHKGKHWKHLVTYPAPIGGLCAVKMMYASFLSLVSTGLYCLASILAWVLFVKVTPELHGFGPPVVHIFAVGARAWLASLFIIPVQAWLSVVIPGNGPLSLIAIICLVLGIALFDPESRLSYLYPWTLCLSTGELYGAHHNPDLPALVGILGGASVGAIVCWIVEKKERYAVVR